MKLDKYYCQIYYPINFDENHQYPLVVWLKDYIGTPNWRGFFPRYSWLANHGYIVAVLTYRGSSGSGFKFMQEGLGEKMVQSPLADTMAVAEILSKRMYVNSANVGIGGIGWGGYLALMMVCLHPELFKCSFSYGAITDWEIQQAMTSLQKYYYLIPGSWYAENRVFFQQHSPSYLLQDIQIPIFLTHGGKDERVPVIQVRKFITEASRLKLNVHSHIYEDEAEELKKRENLEDWYEKLLLFLNRYLAEWSTWKI